MIIDVLIPARDEEKALPFVLKALPMHELRQVVLVNNGSTDGTAAVATAHGCQLVDCPIAGYGRACLAGMHYLSHDPPEILVFLDGDFSDDPGQIMKIVQPIIAAKADFVLGSRTLGQAEKGSLTAVQRFGNALATRLVELFWGHKYSDLAPYRAISWDALQQLKMTDQNFGWTIEMQIKAVTSGLSITEVSMPYKQRIGTSKISGTVTGSLKAGYKIIWTIFKYRLLI